MELDEKDKKLLTIVQANGRASLTTIAKAIHLSIDATHKRLKRLEREGIIHHFSTAINPKALGFDLVANIQIKLHNIGEDDLRKFIAHLTQHPQVIELISTLGEHDLTCVIISKNTEDLELVSRQIRHAFRQLIADWRSVINLKVHKFEEYAF